MELLQAVLNVLNSVARAVDGIYQSLTTHQLTRTRFISVLLNKDAKQGVPLGQGKCKAIRLKANFFETGLATPQTSLATGILGETVIPAYFYYGDSKQQTWEHPLFIWSAFWNVRDEINQFIAIPNTKESELIYCKDLQDIWVRYPQGELNDESQPTIEIQVQIFD